MKPVKLVVNANKRSITEEELIVTRSDWDDQRRVEPATL